MVTKKEWIRGDWKFFSLSHDRDMTKNIFHAEGCLIWKLSLLYLKRNFFEIIY